MAILDLLATHPDVGHGVDVALQGRGSGVLHAMGGLDPVAHPGSVEGTDDGDVDRLGAGLEMLEVLLGDATSVAGDGGEEAQRLGEGVHVLHLHLGHPGLLVPHLLLEQGVHDDGTDPGVGQGLDAVSGLLDGSSRGDDGVAQWKTEIVRAQIDAHGMHLSDGSGAD